MPPWLIDITPQNVNFIFKVINYWTGYPSITFIALAAIVNKELFTSYSINKVYLNISVAIVGNAGIILQKPSLVIAKNLENKMSGLFV